MLGFSLLAATALAGAAQGPTVPAAAPARTLKDIPNVTVTYYDVTGKNGDAIAKSIAKNAPRAPGSKDAVAGTTNWEMKAEITQRTTNGKCSIASAKAVFSGTATLPRLTTEHTVNRQLQEQWHTYVTGLENGAVANLGFAYDRTGEIEKAILGATCETVSSVGSAAIAQLKQQALDNQKAVIASTPAQASGDTVRREDPPKPADSY